MPGHLVSTKSYVYVENSNNPRRGHAPSSPEHTRRVSRNRLLALLLSSVLAGAMQLPTHVDAETTLITTPAHARMQGLESLRRAVRQDGGVPLPKNLDDFIKDREAAVQLGKALFWDMQVGSDGVQACASCHFHAGADNRSKNQVNPGLLTIVDSRQDDVTGYFKARLANANFRFETRQPNETLRRKDFPFVKAIQDINRAGDGTVGPGVEKQQRYCRVDGHVLHLVQSCPAGVPG